MQKLIFIATGQLNEYHGMVLGNSERGPWRVKGETQPSAPLHFLGPPITVNFNRMNYTTGTYNFCHIKTNLFLMCFSILKSNV